MSNYNFYNISCSTTFYAYILKTDFVFKKIIAFLSQAIDVHIPKRIANCITVAQLAQMITGLVINIYTILDISK